MNTPRTTEALAAAFDALPHPGPLIAQGLRSGHVELYQATVEEDNDWEVMPRRYRSSLFLSSKRIMEVKFVIYPFLNPPERRGRQDYDFDSTAEEIVEPEQLPPPPRQLPPPE